MNYNDCYCQRDYNNMAMLASALNEVMTERYWIFRKQKRCLFWDYTEEVDVRVPKDYQSDYKQKIIEFKMRCIELIDKGYKNGYVTEDLCDNWRKEISEHLMNKNVMWE